MNEHNLMSVEWSLGPDDDVTGSRLIHKACEALGRPPENGPFTSVSIGELEGLLDELMRLRRGDEADATGQYVVVSYITWPDGYDQPIIHGVFHDSASAEALAQKIKKAEDGNGWYHTKVEVWTAGLFNAVPGGWMLKDAEEYETQRPSSLTDEAQWR